MTDTTAHEARGWLLAGVDVLASLSLEELGRLALTSVWKRLDKGETFALDEVRRAVLLLARGRVRLHEPHAAGPGLTISLLEEPTFVTHTGFAARDHGRAVVVEALEPAVLLVVEGGAFDDLVRRDPEVGVKTIRLLGERLFAREGRLSEVVNKEVTARLAGLILRLGEHRAVATIDGGSMIATRYTHKELAGLVGSNREALTRALGKLKGAGAVEVRNRRIHIVGVEVLARIARSGR